MRDFIKEINTIMDVIDGTYKQPLPRREPVTPNVNYVDEWEFCLYDARTEQDSLVWLFANEYYRMTLEED